MIRLDYLKNLPNDKPVLRQKILCQLYNTDSLVMLSAGPGYGKTILLQQITAESPEKKTINLRAEEGDTFFDLLKQIIQELGYPEQDNPLSALEEIAHKLKVPILVTLDDIQRLTWNSSIADSLIPLTQLPKNIQFIFAGRCSPSLWTDGWRLLEHLTIYSEKELSFDLEEIETLITYHLGSNHPTSLSRDLHTPTNGWPLPISRYLSEYSHTSNLKEIKKELLNLTSLCFDTEALAILSEEQRQLIMQTAPLKELLPDLCQQITGSIGTTETLEFLYDNNLFIHKTEQGIYKHLPLFQEYLIERARLFLRPLQHKEIYSRTATWYLENSQPSTAIEYYLHAGQFDIAEQLLSDLGLGSLSQGQDLNIMKVIGNITTPKLKQFPHLLFYRARILKEQGKWEAALSILETIEEVCCNSGSCSFDFQFEVFSVRAWLYIDLGYIEAALEAIATIDTPNLNYRSRARIANLYARSYWLSNNWQQAKDKAKLALQYFRMADDLEGEATMLNDLAAVFYEPQGQFVKALTYFEESYKIRKN